MIQIILRITRTTSLWCFSGMNLFPFAFYRGIPKLMYIEIFFIVFLVLFFRERLGGAITKGWVKILVLALFSAYMYVAIYGFTNIKEGLDKKNTANYDSYSIKYYDMDDTYFKKYAFTISVVFSGPNLSISNVETQQKIDHILQVKRLLTYFMFSYVFG